MKKNLIPMILLGGLIGCGSQSIGFLDVSGIPPGNDAGVALSGDFSVALEVRSGACPELNSGDLPSKGTPLSFDVTVTQDDGALTMEEIWIPLYGGVEFKGEFSVGGSNIFDYGNEKQNVQRFVLIEGTFDDAASFSGSGTIRFVGRVNDEDLDCVYTFTVDGIRK